MRHFLLYHSEDAMGYRLGEARVNVWEGSATRDLQNSMADMSSWAEWADFRGDGTTPSLMAAGPENPESDDSPRYSLVTSNGREAQLCTSEASWVWMIEGMGRPRRYYLKGHFEPVRCEQKPQSIKRRRFLHTVYGYEGRTYDEGLEIGQNEWFLTLKRVHQNFRTGFREIKDSGLINELKEALDRLQRLTSRG